jgi:hypothetical protein
LRRTSKSAGFPYRNISASVLWDICREPFFPKYPFHFNYKLNELCVTVEGKITADMEEKIIALIDGITAGLILPQREKAVV